MLRFSVFTWQPANKKGRTPKGAGYQPSEQMKLPGLVKVGLFTGMMASLGAGVAYTINLAYNDDQVDYLSNDVTQYRKMDGIYAHTVITRGHPVHGRDYFKLERITLEESKIFIGKEGCSSIDTIIIEPGFLSDQSRWEYKRGEYHGLKESFFKTADEESVKQFERFKPLM